MSIAIVIISLVLLITLHELGHFYFAKKFDVKVYEFGIGIPPRVIGKKIGETIYSINLLPLGGFVRMMGEDERVKDERSFSEKPIWQRAIILIAGVASFWLVAVLIFALVSFGWGVLREAPDGTRTDDAFLMVNWIEVDSEYRDQIGIQDRIIAVDGNEVEGRAEFNEAMGEGERILTFLGTDDSFDLTVEDGKEFLKDVDVRRVVSDRGSPLQSLRFGVSQTVNVTKMQAAGIGLIIRGAVTGEGIPEGMEFGGPVMIGSMATDALDRGAGDYLMFVGIIATILAFMNVLPIPALDGGRLLFLAVEKVKGSPIPARVEQTVNAIFFILLIMLMIAITARDIYNIL